MPSLYQAGVYSAVAHYLKAMKSANTDKPDLTMAEMRKLPINDFMTKNGTLREDGRVIRENARVRGEEAGRVEGCVGLLQARAHGVRRGRVPPVVR